MFWIRGRVREHEIMDTGCADKAVSCPGLIWSEDTRGVPSSLPWLQVNDSDRRLLVLGLMAASDAAMAISLRNF